MRRQVRILRRAERDLQQIYDTVAREAPRRVETFIDRMFDRIETLATHADRGAVPRDDVLAGRGLRFLVEGPYLVFYKVLRTQVRVHRVLHGHRPYRERL